MNRRHAGLRLMGTLLAVMAAGSAAAWAQTPRGGTPWVAALPPAQVQAVRVPDAPVRIDVPRKDWMLLPAGRSALLVLASRKGDADVTIERTALQFALAPDDITEVLATVQADAARAREPKAANFEMQVLEAGDRRLVAIQYTRPGVLGQERVRQYSIPVGLWLYHITAAASASAFPSHERTFAHLAASFLPLE